MNKSERNEYMRNMLMMRPDLEEVRAKLKASPEDSMLWYQLAWRFATTTFLRMV